MPNFALPWEQEVAKWLDKRGVNYTFHASVLGENPAVGCIAPFVINDMVIASRERSTPYDEQIAAEKGFSMILVSEDTPIEDLEG